MYDHLPDADLTHHIHVGALAERELATEELRRRHLPAVLAYARVCARDERAAEELAAQAFAVALQERHGLGDIAWRHHLLLLVQCEALPWAGDERRYALAPGFLVRADEARGQLPDRPAPQDLEQLSLMLRGFRRLPPRSQALLWHKVVEEDSDEQLSTLLGLVPGSAAALTENAQEKLRLSFLRACLESGSQECAGFVRIIEAVARQSDSRRSADLERHLGKCPDCTHVLGQLRAMTESYRAVLAEGLFVWGGTAYIALHPETAPSGPVFPTPRPVRRRAKSTGGTAATAQTTAQTTAQSTAPTATATAADAPGPGRRGARSGPRPLRALGLAILAVAAASVAAFLVISNVNGSGPSDDHAAEPSPGADTTTPASPTPTPPETESALPPPAERDSYRQVVNTDSGLCLDVEDGKLSGGVDTVVAECSNEARTQKWYLDDDGLFRNFADSGFCLDPRGATDKGAGVRKCDAFDEDAGPDDDLRFVLLSEGSIRPFIALDFAVTPHGGSAGSPVRLERADEPTDDEQRWRTGRKAAGDDSASPAALRLSSRTLR